MRLFYTLITVVLLLIIALPNSVHGQCNTAQCITPIPSTNAQDACILPNPAALDCYYGETTADPPVSFPPFWCTVIHNNHWFAFTADATTATFDIACYGCAVGNGIQAAVLETVDCINFNFVSPCIGNIPSGSNAILTATGLVPGQNYYLCIDGSSGAQCEYSINGTQPTINVVGPPDICIPSTQQETYTTSSESVWSINPPGAGTILGNTVGTSIMVNWEVPGPAQVCAMGTTCPNAPLECLDVFIGEDVNVDEFVDLCQGKTVQCAGRTFSAPGTFPVILTSFSGCDSIVNCVVNLIPTVYTTENHNLCQGQEVECAGQTFYAPGTFPVKLTADNGCDSIVNCKINLIPTYVSPFTMINLCGPAQYQVCDNFFNETGVYSEICTSYLGCDSIVNINLAILEPEAIIANPDTIDCDNNSTITLDGSGSPVNPASGGVTLYTWSGPGIIGANNLSKVQVNQPGQYCLIVAHGRGGVYCYDTTCVQVSAISAVPQLPQVSGNLSPCADSTITYVATSIGSPPPTSFVWTTPNNTPYTTIPPSSIQITWTGANQSGQLCVTANNSCGASAPACLPITVVDALIPPQFNGPDTVCAGAGTYLFTLDSLQPGANYTWTVPAGAVLSGSADSVSVDFLNATSGQVCVVAESSCGKGAPICQDVQVMPVPTADLAGPNQLCIGDSIQLTFALTGNGPFDLTWSIGNQNFTLNNISNGHNIKVSPTQNTTYKLVSVSDNTTPAACNAVLADSVAVSVWQTYSMNQPVSICAGESYFAGGGMQTSSGIYYDTLNSIHGCDSVIITALTVNPIDTTVVSGTTCDPTAAGTTTLVLSQTNGCDSVVITSIALLPTDTTLISDTSCDPANVGTFTQSLTNIFGCDSTVITTVLYSESDTTYLTATNCDPAATGVFEQLFTNSENCDSLVITTVSLLPSDTTQLTGVSCNPNQVGTFTQDLTNLYGCDSLVVTTISFVGIPNTNLTATTCDPAAAGVFTNTLITAAGCDSTIITTVNLLPSDTTQLTGVSCNPSQVGTFTQDLTNQYGCDSLVVTTVSFVGIPNTDLTATTCDPAAAGVFTNTLVTAAGCDSTIVTTVNLLPSDTTQLTGTSCNPANVGTFMQDLTNQYGCDSLVVTTVSFVGIPNTDLSATTCDPTAAGVFTNTLVTAAGCDSTIVTTVSLLPSSQTAIQSTTCDPAAAGTFVTVLPNQFGCDSTITETVTLLPSDTTYLQASTCDQAQVGTTFVVLPNQWGCDSTVFTVTTLLPPASCGVTASATGSNIPCGSTTGTITVTATLGEAPFDFDIRLNGTSVATGTLTDVGVPQTVSGLAAGNYTIIVNSPNGFAANTQATVVQLIPPTLTAQTSSNYSGFPISCTGEMDGSAIATANGGLPPYSYSWSNGSSTAQISNLGIGTYTATVTDANNCTATASVQLTEPALLELAFTVSDLKCFGQRDGAIYAYPTGGVPPYRYALNAGAYQSTSVFAGLDEGSYTVTVLDANDCQVTETILVNAPVQLSVDLGGDQTIALGDETEITAIVNVPEDSLLSIVWTPAFDSSACPKCLTQTVKPLITTAYSIQIVSNNGCKANDRILVIVDRRRQLYVPNAFSPNNDGVNDLLNIFAKPGTVRNIKSFMVFDRWGESLYVGENFLPNDESIGWDGRYRGQTLNPGVFAWVMEVEFIDGITEIYTGDVTIIH